MCEPLGRLAQPRPHRVHAAARVQKSTGILAHIGKTPLVRLRHIGRELPVSVLVECEHMNPGGSVEDRVALAIVDDAEARGVLRPVDAAPGHSVIERGETKRFRTRS